jgi:hypothetical protein
MRRRRSLGLAPSKIPQTPPGLRRQDHLDGRKGEGRLSRDGEYDPVVVTEVPNDKTAAKMALGTAMQGNVRTMTMRAFGREEMDKIIGSLP